MPEHFQGTIKQVTKPTNARIGPCDELASHPEVHLLLSIVYPPHDPDRNKEDKNTRESFFRIAVMNFNICSSMFTYKNIFSIIS